MFHIYAWIFATVAIYDVTHSFVLLGDADKNKNSMNVFSDESLPQSSLFFDVILPESHGLKANNLDKSNLLNQSSQAQNGSHVVSNTEKRSQNGGEFAAAKSFPETTLPQRKKPRKMFAKKRRSPSVRYPTQPRRRGLADTGLGLDDVSPKNPWNSVPPEKQGIYISPGPGSGGINGNSADDLYTYAFVGERFELRGSASINFNGVDKFRITFEFSITGDGNATAHLVTPEQEVKYPAWEDNGAKSDFSRPDSCHLQASENKTKPVENCPIKQSRGSLLPVQGDSSTPPPPRRIGARRSRVPPGTDLRYPFLNDQYSFLTSSLMSSYGPSLSESFIFPNQPVPAFDLGTQPDSSAVKNKNCGVTTTTYVRKWLCIGRTAPPCFMMLMQGTKYKVAKKICPQRVYPKKLI